MMWIEWSDSMKMRAMKLETLLKMSLWIERVPKREWQPRQAGWRQSSSCNERSKTAQA